MKSCRSSLIALARRSQDQRRYTLFILAAGADNKRQGLLRSPSSPRGNHVAIYHQPPPSTATSAETPRSSGSTLARWTPTWPLLRTSKMVTMACFEAPLARENVSVYKLLCRFPHCLSATGLMLLQPLAGQSLRSFSTLLNEWAFRWQLRLPRTSALGLYQTTKFVGKTNFRSTALYGSPRDAGRGRVWVEAAITLK